MKTNDVIELISEVNAREPLDWRPAVEAIQKEGFDIDQPCSSEGWTLLQWALEKGEDRVASFAIARGASINARGTGKFDCTPLDVAVRKANDRFVDMFLRHGGAGFVASNVQTHGTDFQR